MIKISVIIPTYNRSAFLQRAIESVLKQTYQNFELIIVDDGSTDKTEELVAKIDDQRIIYKKVSQGGVSSARNIGIELAQSDWIAFLDSDDEWLPKKLQMQIDYIQENPQVPLIHGEEIWIRKGRRVNPKNIHKKFGGEIFEQCLPLCLISPSAAIIKKEILLEMNCFDEDYIVCEDYDLWLKITSRYNVGFIETPIIKKYGGHQDQLSHKYFAMDYYRVKSMARILKIRHFERRRIEIVLNEIISKGNILMAGYKKHDNMRDYDEISGLVTNAMEELNGGALP